MAVSVIKSHNTRLVHTVQGFSNVTINAHYGVGKTITVSIPDGYRLVGHVACWSTGVVGFIAGFDSLSENNQVPVYINNTTDSNITGNFAIHIQSLIQQI